MWQRILGSSGRIEKSMTFYNVPKELRSSSNAKEEECYAKKASYK
jgi:hypothetical protein